MNYKSVENFVACLRSPRTQDDFLRYLYKFLQWTKKQNPDHLLKLKDNEVADLIKIFSNTYEKQGKEKTAQSIVVALKSFYRANNRELKSPKLKVHKVARKRMKRLIPDKETVYRLAEAAANLRDRALILFLCQSGLRNGTMRRLTIEDVREELEKGIIPLKIEVDPRRDKQSLREPYFTFVGKEAVEALNVYLKTRGKLSEFDDKAPLFVADPRVVGPNRPMSDNAVQLAIKKAAENAGVEPDRIWPHCLRASFYNMLVDTVDEDIRLFMFGHGMGARDHYFARDRVEQIRAAYAKVDFSKGLVSASTIELEKRKLALRAASEKNPDEVVFEYIRKFMPQMLEKIQTETISTEELADIYKKTLDWVRKEGYCSDGIHCPKQKIVSESDLENYLDRGWIVSSVLSSGKIVVGQT